MRSTSLMLAALTSIACAQFHAVVGPSIVPPGCLITIAISNDTPSVQSVGCNFAIKDATGTVVAPGGCGALVFPLNPGATNLQHWPQINGFGAPLPPGGYTVEVTLPGGVTSTSITLGGAEAAIAMLGVPKIGTNRNLRFCSPLDGGHAYVGGAALSVSGIPTCAGNVPLALDPLFFYSIDPANAVFLNFAGTLDASGMSSAPSLALPNIPALIGAFFVVDFAVIDPTPCPVRRIAAPIVVTIV